MTAKHRSTKGSFLIAAPGLIDRNFRQTVVLVAEHNEEGAFGLVLNRRGKIRVAELVAEVTGLETSSEAFTYTGGPVQPSSVFILHRVEELSGGADPVLPGLYLAGDPDTLRELVRREEALREEGRDFELYRVYCGYSGWGEGQLDAELETGSWLVQPATTRFIFSTPPEQMWRRTMERQGGPYRIFAYMPPDPERN